jgi:hypothetical protein
MIKQLTCDLTISKLTCKAKQEQPFPFNSYEIAFTNFYK